MANADPMLRVFSPTLALTSAHISYLSWPLASRRGSSDQICPIKYEKKGWKAPGLAPKVAHENGHSLFSWPCRNLGGGTRGHNVTG